MAVRDFAGPDDDIIRSIGALADMEHGTFLFLIKPDDVGSDTVLQQPHDSGGSGDHFGMGTDSADDLFFNDFDFTDFAWREIAMNQWILVLARIASNSDARFSQYVYSSDTWTHGVDGNQGLDLTVSPGSGGTIRFNYQNESVGYEGRVAAIAIWSNTLPWTAADSSDDSTIENAGLETSLANWADADPDALWAFNQLQTSDDVIDITGNGADQTSISGTTVVTDDDPPGFDFGPTVRHFDGASDDLITNTGALSGMAHGAFAAIVKFNSFGQWQTILSLDASEDTQCQFGLSSDDEVSLYNGTSVASAVFINVSDWHLIVVRKASGDVDPRASVRNLSTGSWTHSGLDDTLNDWGSPGAGGAVGMSFDTSSEFFDGRIAARAAWSNSLGPNGDWTADASGDSAIEAAGLETSLANWSGASPDALWAYNQESTATAVDDLTGNGANQTSISGTDVVAGDAPPGFSFDFEPVRGFDGSDDEIITATGSISGMTYGTFAALIKTNDLTSQQTLINPKDDGPSSVAALFLDDTDGDVTLFNGSSSSGSGILLSTDIWYLIVLRKGTGSVVGRASVYNFNTESWSHADLGSALADWSAPGASGEIRFSDDSTSTLFDGLFAVGGIWSNSLGPSDAWTADGTGDTAIENAGLEDSLQDWLDASPDALWRFNQDSVGTAVNDLTGGGADQTSITGTSVVTNDPVPGFSFELTTGDVTATVSHGLVLGHDVAADVIVDAEVSHGLVLGHDVDATVGGVLSAQIAHGLVLGHDVAADVIVDAVVEHGLVLGHEVSVSIASDVEVDLSHGLVLGHEMSAETVQTTNLVPLKVVILQAEEV